MLKDKDQNLQGEDIREGMTAVISVKVKEPQFEGQTKTKLGNSNVTGIVANLEKCISASRAREAARKARELARKKSSMEGSTLPRKTCRL